ncbi:MAG: hypothetical protein V3R87_07935 [Dehalococcoidia bacterium]
MGIQDRDWYRGSHPPACNCVQCTKRRLSGRDQAIAARVARFLKRLVRKR